MKYAFLGSRVSIIVLSLLVGLIIGFKIANSQYRAEQSASLDSAVARVTGTQAGQPTQAQVRAIIDKARSNPSDVEAQLDAADQFIQIGNGAEALPFLEAANKVKPNDARVTAGLAMANFMTANYENTILWAGKSIELEPQNPGASFLLIASYIRSNKNLDEAERMINKLESEGIDSEMIARAREELKTARSSTGSKTVLDHGPQDPGPGKSNNR